MKENYGSRESRRYKEEASSEVPSFNDVTDHYQSILGVPDKKADINNMPKPLRWFAYFFYSVIIFGALIFIISMIVQR
ncbi:hypothetical protein ACFSL6_22075 [Paenibacillus thailandensis]|uniref:Amino acid transporter n=1 Tax=Paenibacillus thailandensis TaxID=393250 RepID=A0ABW5R3U0_9BACL